MDIYDFKKFYVRSLHELHTNSEILLSRLEEEIFYAANQGVVVERNGFLFSYFQKALDDHFKEVFCPVLISLPLEVQGKSFFMVEDYLRTSSEIEEHFSQNNFDYSSSVHYLNDLNKRINILDKTSSLPYLLEGQGYKLVEVDRSGFLNINTDFKRN